jgi:hypothetical protein
MGRMTKTALSVALILVGITLLQRQGLIITDNTFLSLNNVAEPGEFDWNNVRPKGCVCIEGAPN